MCLFFSFFLSFSPLLCVCVCVCVWQGEEKHLLPPAAAATEKGACGWHCSAAQAIANWAWAGREDWQTSARGDLLEPGSIDCVCKYGCIYL